MDFHGFLWILRILVRPGKNFHGSVDFEGFSKFWLDLGRICMDPWILKGFYRILVRSGTDFHGSVDFRGFWLDLGRISMDPWILKDL